MNNNEISSRINKASTPIPNHITPLKEDKYSIGIINRAAIRPVAINTIKYFQLNLRCQARNSKGTTRLKSKIEPNTNPLKLEEEE